MNIGELEIDITFPKRGFGQGTVVFECYYQGRFEKSTDLNECLMILKIDGSLANEAREAVSIIIESIEE